jgi:hypothetical protein
MKRGRIAERFTPRIADPVRSEELWRQYGIGKGKAFRLWQTGECAGQTLGRGMLVLSRADVEQWQQKREPGLGPA